MFKFVISVIMGFLTMSESQIVGSQRGDHDCVMDGGYQWCESLNKCVRPWLTPCPRVVVDPLPPTPISPILPPPPPPAIPLQPSIPKDCKLYFDGCNRCMVRDGRKVGCTKMMCFTKQPAKCVSYNTLHINDICYRFCEDGSEINVNKKNKCPHGTICSQSLSIGYDSCGKREWRCIPLH